MKFRQASNFYKSVPKAVKLTYANTLTESIPSQKLGSRNFCELLTMFSLNVNVLLPPIFNRSEVLFSGSDKAKMSAEIFFKNSNIDDLGICLPSFASGTTLKM